MVNRLFLLLLLFFLLGPLVLQGQAGSSGVAYRKLGVNWKNKVPFLSYSARDFVNPFVVKRLQSGLPQSVITRTYAYSDRDHSPVAISIRSCRITFDLWEERYHVQIRTEKRSAYQSIKSLETVKRTCLVFINDRIGKPSHFHDLRGSWIYFAVIVELNAISDRTVERMRRWLARSEEGSKMTGGAFFGSFVSIFVNRRIGSSERILRFRSPLHRVP
jgi:hypothetical protein